MVSVSVFADLERGRLSFTDLVGADPVFIDQIRTQGLVAFSAGQYGRAATIFAGLEALEPAVAEHKLHLGHAEANAGNRDAAVAALTRYLQTEPEDRAEHVRALLTRALLASDPSDVERARQLAGEDPALIALVDEIGGAS